MAKKTYPHTEFMTLGTSLPTWGYLHYGHRHNVGIYLDIDREMWYRNCDADIQKGDTTLDALEDKIAEFRREHPGVTNVELSVTTDDYNDGPGVLSVSWREYINDPIEVEAIKTGLEEAKIIVEKNKKAEQLRKAKARNKAIANAKELLESKGYEVKK